MSQYDPVVDHDTTPSPALRPVMTETIVVRPDSGFGWWLGGALTAAVLLVLIWLAASNTSGQQDAVLQARLAEAEAVQLQAQAQAASASAQVQGQMADAQARVAVARADAARAQAEAQRAMTQSQAAPAADGAAPVIVSTTPQP